MRYQTDPAFNGVIQHFGCYFFSILAKVEKCTRADRPFSVDEIKGIYSAALVAGYISPEVWGPSGDPIDGCFVLDVDGVLRLAGARATLRTRPDGKGGKTASFPPDWPDIGTAEIIQRWEKVDPVFSHFVSGADRSRVELDPIRYANGKGSFTVAAGRVVSLRLIDFTRGAA